MYDEPVVLRITRRRQSIAGRAAVALLALVMLCGSAFDRPPRPHGAGALATSPLSVDAGPTHLRAPVGIVRLAVPLGHAPVSQRHDCVAVTGVPPASGSLVAWGACSPRHGHVRPRLLDAATPLRGPPAHA